MQIPDAIARRNFTLNIVEGVLFLSTAGFTSVQTVLPALVSRLGGSNVAVGAVSVFSNVGVFLPQIFAARYIETLPWKKPWTIRFGMSHRIVLGLIGLAILLFGESSPGLALGLFLSLFAFGQMLAGITSPGWFDFFAKLTPPGRMGTLAGIRNSLGGAAAFIAGLVLTWLLHAVRFPYSYAVAFFVACSLQMGSLAVQMSMTEREPSAVASRSPLFAYLRGLPQALRTNVTFRNFIIASAVTILATMPANFFTVYALSEFRADESIVGEFTLILVATQVVSAYVNGVIADRRGNKRALIIAAGAMCCASIWALLAPSIGWFKVVYVFVGVQIGTEMMARYNMAIQYGPTAHRSRFVGMMNTLLAPFYLSSILGGWISDTLGYHAVFAIGAALSILGIGLMVYLVRDPGKTRPVVSLLH